ncbi:segregation/condensation protein A [Patescibacteria group bacterium]|jgi:segregation and condensation protein A|nr:segregation/condensation protein A [Patescibacteria group bacterium]
MAYSVRIEAFEGPLDLLLQLIESEKMEITSISLLQVTEPFVQHVRENHGLIPPEDLADFLVVAAKLVYLKSKAILPHLHDPDLEEGPDLETQLRLYKAFVEASSKIAALEKLGKSSYTRTYRAPKQEGPVFTPPEGVTGAMLQELYRQAIRRIEPLIALPKASMERAITIEEKIEQLRNRVSKLMHSSFHRFLTESQDKHEMVVSFLALLELIKQRIVHVEQETHFSDIRLTIKHPV